MKTRSHTREDQDPDRDHSWRKNSLSNVMYTLRFQMPAIIILAVELYAQDCAIKTKSKHKGWAI